MKTLYKSLFIFSMFALATACSSKQIATETRSVQVTKVIPISPKATETISITNPPTSIKVPMVIASPSSLKVKNLSPANRVVPFVELGLGQQTIIFVYDNQNHQVLSISSQDKTPAPMLQFHADINLDTIAIDPSHQWLAYSVVDDGGLNIWISSINGSTHFLGMKSAQGTSFRWISNHEIVVYETSGRAFDCPNEYLIVNPFSKEKRNFFLYNETGRKYCFPVPFFSPNSARSIILDNTKGWVLYNNELKTSDPILPDLDTTPGSNKYFFYWGDQGLSFAIPEKNKIAFITNLLEKDYTSPLSPKILFLPQNTINEDQWFDFWIPELQLSGFDLGGAQNSFVLGCGMQKTFVTVDLIKQELRNYCLDRSIVTTQSGGVWSTFVSADNRYVGWAVHKLPGNIDNLGSVILDLETGYLSYLEGYELIGFGVLKP